MFDIGWVEMMVVVIVMVIVVGPKELPGLLRTIGRGIAQVRAMARTFQDSIEELAEETGLDEVRDEVRAIRDFRLEDEIEKTIDPDGELREGIDAKLEDTKTENGEADADAAKIGADSTLAEDTAEDKATDKATDNGADNGEDKAKADNADPGAGGKT